LTILNGERTVNNAIFYPNFTQIGSRSPAANKELRLNVSQIYRVGGKARTVAGDICERRMIAKRSGLLAKRD